MHSKVEPWAPGVSRRQQIRDFSIERKNAIGMQILQSFFEARYHHYRKLHWEMFPSKNTRAVLKRSLLSIQDLRTPTNKAIIWERRTPLVTPKTSGVVSDVINKEVMVLDV